MNIASLRLRNVRLDRDLQVDLIADIRRVLAHAEFGAYQRRMRIQTEGGTPGGGDGWVVVPVISDDGFRVECFDAADVQDLEGQTGSANDSALRLSAFPNPARGDVSIRFSLDTASPVIVSVHDVAGRSVRTVTQGTLPAGAHDSRWDGRNGEGQDVGSGIYFLRVATPEGESTVRVVRVG